MDQGFHLSGFDKIFSILILAAGTVFGTGLAIGPVAWDDTLYLHTAAALARDPTILTRYFHIFLLRLGIFLAGGNPFSGAFLTGAFTFSLTAALVYLNARLISKAAHPWHGLIALLFLLAEPLFLENFGVPLADYTAMLMVSLGIFCYLVTVRQEQPAYFHLALNGLVFFLAIKSKELCGVLIVFWAALIAVHHQPRQWKDTGRRFLAVLSGMAAGLVLFIILDGLLLKDPWFGLRLSDFQAEISFNLNQGINFTRQQGSYFDLFSRIGLLAPFCLAIISGVTARNRLRQGEWAIWLLIPALFFALTIGQVKGAFGVIDRYAIPALPVLAVLAPQFLPIKLQNETGLPRWVMDALILVLIGAAALVVYFFSQAVYTAIGKPAGWSQADFITSILGPLALSLLLAVILFLSDMKRASFITILCLILVLTVPQIQVYRRGLVSGLTRQASLDRYLPMTIFKKQVSCTTSKVYVSSRYHDDMNRLSRDQQSTFWMFDLAFGCISQIDQFDFSNTPAQILATHYQYAFLPKKDFDGIMAKPDQAVKLRQMYAIANDPMQEYYLLSRK